MPGRKSKRIQKEQHQRGVSLRSIAIKHVDCSIGTIAPQETTCAPVAQVTADVGKEEDVSVSLDSAAVISDHETTGLLESSAVCCSNEMEAYQPNTSSYLTLVLRPLHL